MSVNRAGVGVVAVTLQLRTLRCSDAGGLVIVPPSCGTLPLLGTESRAPPSTRCGARQSWAGYLPARCWCR